MIIGKAENTSASFIQPEWNRENNSVNDSLVNTAMQTGMDIAPNAIDSLAQKLTEQEPVNSENIFAAAYGVDISDDGRSLCEQSSLMKNNINELLSNGTAELNAITEDSGLNINTKIDTSSDDKILFTITMENCEEVFSLAFNMQSIEGNLNLIFKYGKKDEYGGGTLLSFQGLAQALNAYSHKKNTSAIQGNDDYLNSILTRLDQIDSGHNNALANEIRQMTEMALSGQDIDWQSDNFTNKIKRAWKENRVDYLAGSDSSLVKSDTADTFFNEKIAIYSYMQEMQQQSQTISLVNQILGSNEADKENQDTLADKVQLKNTLEDGLNAYKHDMRIVHLLNEDDLDYEPAYGKHDDSAIVEKPNEEPHNSALGYDWQQIMKAYLKANPEIAKIVQSL